MLDGVDGDANPERLGDPQEVIRGARAERLTYPLLVNRPVGPSGDSPATGTSFGTRRETARIRARGKAAHTLS